MRRKMKTYKVVAGETIYASYEIEVKAKDKEEAEKIALNTPTYKWDDERFENADGISVDEIEEIE